MFDHLLLDGAWVATDTWDEILSPYSGDVVGRVPRADAALARRAVDSAHRAMAQPLPAWRRAEIGRASCRERVSCCV